MKKGHDIQPFTVENLSRLLDCRYEGQGKTKVMGVASLEEAKEGDLVFLAGPKYLPLLEKSKASAAIIPLEIKYKRIPVIKSKNPYLTFIKAVDFFYMSGEGCASLWAGLVEMI